MSDDVAVVNKGKKQLSESRGLINLEQRKTYEEISNVKLRNERLERDRRDQEEIQRQGRFNAIQDEAIASSKQNAALEMKWSELREIEECETLFNELQEQKKAFQEILDGKNNLIKMFQDELYNKDEDYTKLLKQQNHDIDEIISKMRSQFKHLRSLYSTQLDEIERESLADREFAMLKNKGAIEEVVSMHDKWEQNLADKRNEIEEKNEKEIDNRRIEDARTYAETKIQMETEIQSLEKCLEDMKALYQLNAEKLDYNTKVLKEKDEENDKIRTYLRAKERTAYNKLRNLVNDYRDVDKLSKLENKKLTEEYKRITRQFKELQRKFRHFEKADLERYNEIQKMNELEVRELKEKIQKADETIHIQQLGMKWTPLINDDQNPSQDASRLQQSQSHSTKYQDQIDAPVEEFQLAIPEEELELMIDVLVSETQFLLDEKTREDIASVSAEEQRAVRLEAVKKCMGIDSIEEFNMLLEELSRYVRVESVRNPMLEEDMDEEEMEPQEDNYDIEYDPDRVVECLINFINPNKKVERQQILAPILEKKKMKQESDREKKERIAREGRKYWERLTQVLPDHSLRVWKILDNALSRYHDLLLERQKLIESTGDLHSQNDELKHLLDQYFNLNHELIIPPTKTIQIDPFQ